VWGKTTTAVLFSISDTHPVEFSFLPIAEQATESIKIVGDITKTRGKILSLLRGQSIDIRKRAFLEEYFVPFLELYHRWHFTMEKKGKNFRGILRLSGENYTTVFNTVNQLKSTGIISSLKRKNLTFWYFDLDQHGDNFLQPIMATLSSSPNFEKDLRQVLQQMTGLLPEDVITALGHEILILLGGDKIKPELLLLFSMADPAKMDLAGLVIDHLIKRAGFQLETQGKGRWIFNVAAILPNPWVTELSFNRFSNYGALTTGQKPTDVLETMAITAPATGEVVIAAEVGVHFKPLAEKMDYLLENQILPFDGAEDIFKLLKKTGEVPGGVQFKVSYQKEATVIYLNYQEEGFK
jgi:hypothetical protein